MQHLHNNDPRFNLYKRQIISFFMSHYNRMSQENLITLIWVLAHLRSKFLYNNYHYKRTPVLNLHKLKGRQNKKKKHRKTTSNGCHKYLQNKMYHTVKMNKQTAYMSQHELSARNKFPASNLEKGWIIVMGTSFL